MFKFLWRILLFPLYFVACVMATFASFIVHFASWIIGIVLTIAAIGGVCAFFMQDFYSVGTALVLLVIASVFITIIGLAQGFLEGIRNAVCEAVFG